MGVIGIVLSIYFGSRYYYLKNSVAAINSPGAEVVGGDKITAHNVYAETPDRHLNDVTKSELDKRLKELGGESYKIYVTMGGGYEASQFSKEIESYLKSIGWDVQHAGTLVVSVKGIAIQKGLKPDGEDWIIVVGNK